MAFIHSFMWTPEEDDRLRALIERHGARRWKDLAQKLGNKTAKQCRRRYTGHLTTALKEHEWTAEEDEALLRAHEELGNKWTAIAKTVGGRTDNGAKNRFKALMQKMNASKRGKKRGTPTTSPRAGAGAGTPTRGRRRVGTRTRESVEEGAHDVGDDGDGRRGKRRVASATRGRRGGAAKRAKTTPTSPASPSKMRASLDELAARQNGANGISPTLFVSSPTNSVSAFDRTAAWRPVLTVNASSREHSAAGASGDAPTSPGAFARCYSVGKTLSLSCAELELLKEVQEMIIPHGMSQSHGGARSNASAFVRFPNGAGELSQGTADAQHVMNWLLSATPGAADAPQDGSKKTGARGASSRDDGGSIKVSLVPNEEHSLVDEVGRAGQRNQTHYHRHYYDGDQLHMRWETATPEKRIRPMVDALPADPSLIARAAGAEEFRGDDLDAREKRLEARKSGRRSPVDVRNSVRDKLKNSVAFSGNAQTAAVRLRHAFKRHARRGVSAGGGALLLLGARGMVGSGAGAVAAPTDVGQVLRELGVELDESELEALLGEVQGNAVPVEAVVRDVARCVAGVC